MSNDGTGSTLPTTQPPPPPPPRPPAGAARAQCRHAHGDKIKCSTARGGWAGLLVLHAAGWRPPLPLGARAWRGWWCWPEWPRHWLSRLNRCSQHQLPTLGERGGGGFTKASPYPRGSDRSSNAAIPVPPPQLALKPMPSAPTAHVEAVAARPGLSPSSTPGTTARASQQGTHRKAYQALGCERATTLPNSNSDRCRRRVVQGLLRIIIGRAVAVVTR